VISDRYWIVPWGGKARAAETKVFRLARIFKREKNVGWISVERIIRRSKAMSDPVLIFMLSILAGSLSGFATAAIYIRSRQQYLDEQALQLRRAARRLENAVKEAA